jgi:hypothetical protein
VKGLMTRSRWHDDGACACQIPIAHWAKMMAARRQKVEKQELAELLVVGGLLKAVLLRLVSQSLKQRDLMVLPQMKLTRAKEQPQVELVLCWASKKTVYDVEPH